MDEDIIANWTDAKVRSQEKRADNRAASKAILEAAGIPLEVKNNGAHLIVGKPPLIDFWPGTGKWIVRATQRPGRGVYPLLKLLKET